MTGRRSRQLGHAPLDAADEELVAAARDVIDARTDAGPDEDASTRRGPRSATLRSAST